MTNPLPSLASADRRQREQNAAAVSPTYSPAAASPFSQVGVFALKAIAHIKAPEGVVKS